MPLHSRILRIYKRYPISLFIIAIILYLSLGNISCGDDLTKIKYIDKIAHFCMYAGFSSVLWFEYYISHTVNNRLKLFFGAVIAPILFSAAMEIAQTTLTDNRNADWYDLLFNILGTLFAAILGMFVIKPIAERFKRSRK